MHGWGRLTGGQARMAWPQTAPVLSGAEPSAGGRNQHPRPRGLAGGWDPEHLLTAAKVAPQGAWGDLPEMNKGHIRKKDPDSTVVYGEMAGLQKLSLSGFQEEREAGHGLVGKTAKIDMIAHFEIEYKD